MVMENTGGRVCFQEYPTVRLLSGDGTVSEEIFTILSSRSDRKGHVTLLLDGKEIKVHHRRLLPIESAGKAVVIEMSGKYNALCSKCGFVAEVGPTFTFNCPSHGDQDLLWVGYKPNAIKEAKTANVKHAPGSKFKSKENKSMKVKKIVDLQQLSSIPDCELYTQANVPFDHARIQVKSHVLLYTGDNPRKLCFNTYDGTLGKRSEELPIDAFVANDTQGNGFRWYAVKDLNKTRSKLINDGYEKA
jgi:hypothetical protein